MSTSQSTDASAETELSALASEMRNAADRTSDEITQRLLNSYADELNLIIFRHILSKGAQQK